MGLRVCECRCESCGRRYGKKKIEDWGKCNESVRTTKKLDGKGRLERNGKHSQVNGNKVNAEQTKIISIYEYSTSISQSHTHKRKRTG